MISPQTARRVQSIHGSEYYIPHEVKLDYNTTSDFVPSDLTAHESCTIQRQGKEKSTYHLCQHCGYVIVYWPVES